MSTNLRWDSPIRIADEYAAGCNYKAGLGRRGLFEQSKVNERFYIGDQWHGVHASAERPLVRENIIKRIGDYKMALIGSNPISVNYTADGISNTVDMQNRIQKWRSQLALGVWPTEEIVSSEDEVNLVMAALSDYFRVTAERLRFDELKSRVLRQAYISGTGLLYTYWDDHLKTGLYADEAHTTPILGDIRCEVLDVENVCFGDPTLDDIQEQPYILVVQRRRLDDIKLEMKRLGRTKQAENLRPDHIGAEEGETGKATVITKFYREWDETGTQSIIRAVRVCGNVTVRPAWSLGIRQYPLAKFQWEPRRRSIYGESEITHLIPNQIAINRMVTASVWAVMMMGIPIMVVNGDVVQQKVTNDPGQVIRVYGSSEDVNSAIRYIQPPNFSPQFDANIASLIRNTMSQSGANDAALGNMNPDNTSAIIALREAAALPMQTMQNQFYAFVEDVARIWAEFWVSLYGPRSLKIEDDSGIWYLPFDGNRYRDVLISVRTDVGASSLWSEAQSVQTLDNLFSHQVIDAMQYLSRLPKGTVPNLSGLLRELQEAKEVTPPVTEGGDALEVPLV
ncbi:MAG: hypothetical protein IJC17_05490 [Clostridia bacterium]|nr:hypothetical protein [Clostridia bacterium]